MGAFCPQCGKPVGPKDQFCSNCGAPLESAPAQGERTVPPGPDPQAGPQPGSQPGPQPWQAGPSGFTITTKASLSQSAVMETMC